MSVYFQCSLGESCELGDRGKQHYFRSSIVEIFGFMLLQFGLILYFSRYILENCHGKPMNSTHIWSVSFILLGFVLVVLSTCIKLTLLRSVRTKKLPEWNEKPYNIISRPEKNDKRVNFLDKF